MLKLFKRKDEKSIKPVADVSESTFEKGSLLCPKCKVIMNKTIYKNVVMDVCPNCNSKFLDDGELEKIEGFKNFKM